jgi:hypothetical protein
VSSYSIFALALPRITRNAISRLSLTDFVYLHFSAHRVETRMHRDKFYALTCRNVPGADREVE